MPFPIDLQIVKRIEAKIGRKIPLGYIAKMGQDNGESVVAGPDSWELHPIFDDSDKKRHKRTCDDIVRQTKEAREWPDFPECALSIGANGSGDRLVILADRDSDRYADAIYWWDHETGELETVVDDFSELK